MFSLKGFQAKLIEHIENLQGQEGGLAPADAI